jgi:hypothetical protein
MQEADPERIARQQAVRGASSDFSKVPVFAPDLPSRSESRPLLLRKVAIGPVDDPLEHEADRVADQVLRMPASPTVALTAAPQVSRKSVPCEEEHGGQPKRADPARGPAGEAPALVHEVLSSPGRPLDAATRAYFEPRFNSDFGAVRVHTGAQATASARQVNSLAYTVGTNVVFRSDTYAPDTLVGKGLLAHELAHVVQQRHATANGPLSLGRPGVLAEQEAELAANGLMSGRQAAFPRGTEEAAHVVRRSPAPRTPPKPSPPEWLGPLRASATHLQGDIWDVQIASLGRSPVGPHDQMQAYLRVLNQNRPPNVEPMQSAHIIGGEHIRDLGWDMPYNKAPCIGVTKSLHDKWTREISNLQSQQGPMGGRTTKTAGRPIVGPKDVIALHDEVYRGIPELQAISKRIVELEARRIMGVKYGMPKPTSPMKAHQSGMAKPRSPMDVHQGSPMPRPKSPMDVHQGSPMPRPKSPMDVHQGSPMPKPKSPMDVHQGRMPKPKLGGISVEGALRAPAIEKPPLLEKAVLGGLMESLILTTVMELLIICILGQEDEPVEPRQIEEAFRAVTPEIEAVLQQRGVGEDPSGEFASLLQRTKGGQIIYANISLEILPPVLRSGIPVSGQDPYVMRTEMHLTGVNLSTTNLATKEPLKLSTIVTYPYPERRKGVPRVVSIPIYDPNAIATELLTKSDIV